MNDNLITIRFVRDLKLENNFYQISKTMIEKYPDSIFNFCRDCDNDTIELNTDDINYGEFQQVLDVINGNKSFWNIRNDKIKKFIKDYGFIDATFEKYWNTRINKVTDDMIELNDFVYGDKKHFIPQNANIYNDLKQLALEHKHIISIQFFDTSNTFKFINVLDFIPIYICNAYEENNIALKIIDNDIDINKSRQDVIQKTFYQRHNCVFKNIYSKDALTYLSICVCLIFNNIITFDIEAKISVEIREKDSNTKIDIREKNIFLTNQNMDPPSEIFRFNESILSLFQNDTNILIQEIINYVLDLNKWKHIYTFRIKCSNKIMQLDNMEHVVTVPLKCVFLNLKNLGTKNFN